MEPAAVSVMLKSACNNRSEVITPFTGESSAYEAQVWSTKRAIVLLAYYALTVK